MRLIKTLEELQTSVHELAQHDTIGYDLETTGLDPKTDRILLVSLTTKDTTYVLDYTALELATLQYLKPMFTTAFIVGANITFDYKFLFWHTGIRIARMTDVMVNEQVLTAGKFVPYTGKNPPFSLASIAYRRLDITLDKGVRDEFINYAGTLTDEAYIYAGKDTEVLLPIWEQQQKEIKKHKLERIINDIENRLLPVTAHMELTGVLLDTKQLQSLEEPFQRYIDTTERVFQDMIIANGGANRIICDETYYTVTMSSKPQVIEALNLVGVDTDSLDAKALSKWDLKKNKDSLEQIELLLRSDEDDIHEAIEKFGGYNNPYLRAYSFYVGAEKLLGAYIKGLQKRVHADGYWYPWFRQCGARATGRYSSDAQQVPKDQKLQNLGLPYSIRECIIAPNGKKLIIADFSAIELVILADRSGDTRLVQEILRGDIHVVVTQEVMGNFWPIAKEITKANKKLQPYETLRDFSKTLSFGIAYGVTGKSLAEQAATKLSYLNLKFTAKQGDQAVELWKQSFPQAGVFLNKSATMAISEGYTDSIWGRKRWFDLDYIARDKWKLLAAQREGSNQRIQSTSADMTKLAMIYTHNMLDSRKAQIMLSIHDEIVLVSDEDYAEQAAYILKNCMQQAAKDILVRLGDMVIVEPSISDKYDK